MGEEVDAMEVENEENQVKVFKFRNYTPMDKSLYYAVIQKKGDEITYEFPSKPAHHNPENKSSEMEIENGEEEEKKASENLEQSEDQQQKQPEQSQEQRQQLPKTAAPSNDMKKLLEKYNIVSSNIIAEELARLDGENENGEANLVPKKINWDLKEQIAPKLEKLNKRTQKAIVEILREKFALENQS